MTGATSTPRRSTALVGTVLLSVAAVTLVACSGGQELAWTEFGLDGTVATQPVDTSGTSESTLATETTGVVSTTTEPEYSGEGAWLYLSANEVDPGQSYSLQVIGFKPNSDVDISFRSATGSTTRIDTITTDSEGGKIVSYVLPRSTPEGDHRVLASGTQQDGSSVTVGQRLTVDLTKPVIGAITASPATVAAGGTVAISVGITDTYGNKTARVTALNGGTAVSWCDKTATLVAGSDEQGTWRVSCTVPAGLTTGSFTVKVTATDRSDNATTTTSASAVFSIGAGGGGGGTDVTPPSIASASASPSSVAPGGTVTLTARVTDLTGVNDVRFIVRTPTLSDAAWCNAYAAMVSGTSKDGTWRLNCTVPNIANAGPYGVEVIASDLVGNYQDSTQQRASFDVTGVSDFDAPAIGTVSASPSATTIDSTVSVSASVTDASGVGSIFILAYDSTGTPISCSSPSLTSGVDTDGTWTTSCSVGSVTGTYTVEVVAIDVLGNSTDGGITRASFTVS